MKISLLALMIFCSSISYSQISRSDSIRKSYSWASKNLFYEYNLSGAILGELYYTPINEVVNDNGTKSSYQTFGLTMASFSFEPRVNMINVRDYASVSLNVPVNVAISFDQENVGFFHFTFPLLINLNFFYHSTYNNIDFKGFSLGFGAQYIAAPLFINDQGNYITSWIQPLVRAQYKFENRTKNKGRCLGFTLGFIEGQYFRFSYGRILKY